MLILFILSKVAELLRAYLLGINALLWYLELGFHIHMHLKNGAKIAIIGGGPAGSFFAHFALMHAKQLGIKVSVTIFEKNASTRKAPQVVT